MSSEQEPKPKRWWLWYAWEFSAVIAGVVGGLVIALQTYFYPDAPFNIIFVDAAIVILVMGLVMHLCVWNTWPKWNGKGLFVSSIGLASLIAIASIAFAIPMASFAFEHPEIRDTFEAVSTLFVYYIIALFGGVATTIFAAFVVATSKNMRTNGLDTVNLAVLSLPIGFGIANTLISVTYLHSSSWLALPLVGGFIGAVFGLFPGIVFLLCGISPKLQRSSRA